MQIINALIAIKVRPVWVALFFLNEGDSKGRKFDEVQ